MLKALAMGKMPKNWWLIFKSSTTTLSTKKFHRDLVEQICWDCFFRHNDSLNKIYPNGLFEYSFKKTCDLLISSERIAYGEFPEFTTFYFRSNRLQSAHVRVELFLDLNKKFIFYQVLIGVGTDYPSKYTWPSRQPALLFQNPPLEQVLPNNMGTHDDDLLLMYQVKKKARLRLA